MADVDVTKGSSNRSLGGGVVRISNRVDFAAATKTKGSALVSTDVLQMLTVPAGMHVQNVFIKIVTASAGTTLSATIGDTDVDGWDAAVDFKAAAKTITYGIGGTDAHATTNGKVYAAADTIDAVLTVDTVTTWGVFDVVAMCFDPTTI